MIEKPTPKRRGRGGIVVKLRRVNTRKERPHPQPLPQYWGRGDEERGINLYAA